jgi:hypothetical protein
MLLQDIAHARLEFEITCFGAIQDLLTKTGAARAWCRCCSVFYGSRGWACVWAGGGGMSRHPGAAHQDRCGGSGGVVLRHCLCLASTKPSAADIPALTPCPAAAALWVFGLHWWVYGCVWMRTSSVCVDACQVSGLDVVRS